MKKYRISIFVLVLVVVFISQRSITNSDLKIGGILMLSGIGADYGENSKLGMDLAIKEINLKGGVLGKKITADYQDNKGDSPKEAINAFNSLLSKKVRFIVGPNWTPSGTALAPLIKNDNSIVISPSLGSDKFALSSPNTFNVWPPDKKATYALADYIFKNGYKKVAIFASKQEWENDQSVFFQERFKEIGGVITDVETPSVGNMDLKTESSKIIASNPEAVVFTNYGEMNIASLRLREQGFKSSFFAVLLDSQTIEQAKGALDGAVFVTFNSPTEDFVTKFKNEYGKPPRVSADTAYDAVYLLKQAIEKAGTDDVLKVRAELSKIREYSGASGVFTFDENGISSKSPVFYKVFGKEYKRI
jgi:branched-chain amino acid transport system substrate-binding protein